jgi:hypothetical protein
MLWQSIRISIKDLLFLLSFIIASMSLYVDFNKGITTSYLLVLLAMGFSSYAWDTGVAQLYTCVSYYQIGGISLANTAVPSSRGLLSIDNNINLEVFFLDGQSTDYIQTFTATVFINILLVQGCSTMVDLSLIIGNLLDTLLSGFVITSTLYFYIVYMLHIT